MMTKQNECVYDLPELPADVVLRTDENCKDRSLNKWSGTYPIPQIGHTVTINFNQLGAGVVQSYFIEFGYVGVCVKLNNEPKWHAKQNKNTKYAGIALVFGKEISYDPAQQPVTA